MLATRANDGVTALVRPVSPRCVNTRIDKLPPTSPMQQLVPTHPLGQRFLRADHCLFDSLSFFASKDCTYTDSSGRPVPAPKGAEPMPQRFRDDTRVPRQPQVQESLSPPEVHDSPRATPSHPFTFSSSTAVTLPPTSRKRRRSGSDPGMPSSSDSQWTSDALMRPAGLEANIVRDLVNCARSLPVHFPLAPTSYE